MPPIVVTASTSVVLVNSSNQPIPTIYFPAISTVGRLVTIRDSDGFVSTGNYIYLQGCNGVTFGNGLSTLSITQPYGFLTLNATSPNYYSIVNTFAFPEGSTAAYVSNVTASTMYITNQIAMRDLVLPSTNFITASNGQLCFNNVPTGTVTPEQLTSTTIAVEDFASNLLFINVRRLVAVGSTSNTISNIANPTGSIIYSDNDTPWDLSDGGTAGFSNGGIDVYNGGGLWVACGNNSAGTNSCNTGYLQYSLDGKFWVNSVSPNLNTSRLRNRVYWANNLYHAVGYNDFGVAPYGGAYTILLSPDGKNWVPSQGTPFEGSSASNFATSIAFGAGRWVTSGVTENTTGRTLLNSTDGSNWSASITNWSATPPAAYDVFYNGIRFVALVKNTLNNVNIATSVNGTSWSVAGITNGNLGNEPGYVFGTRDQWMVVTPNYHRFSVDSGFTWLDIQDFPSGYPFRPYYDGELWWASVSTNTTAQSLYYSVNGSNQWFQYSNGGGFENGGYARSFYSVFSQSNLNLQLLSSMQGISINFATSNFSACNVNANNISANAITLGTDAEITTTNFLVACVQSSTITRSLFWSDDNGLTYTPALSGGFNNGANNVAYNGNSLWVAVGSSSNAVGSPSNALNSIQWSATGKNWNPAATGGFSFNASTLCEGIDIKYANGYWVATGCNDLTSQTILRSVDGSNWSGVGTNDKFSSIGFSIASGTNALGQFMWVGVGRGSNQANTIMWSIDNGGTWNNATSGGFSSLLGRGVTYGFGSGNLPTSGRWVAVGRPSSVPNTNGILYSDTGSNWVAASSQQFTDLYSVEYNPYLQQFVATGGFDSNASGPFGVQSTILYSQDGITWNTARTGGFLAGAGLVGGTSVTYSDSNWFVSGVSTTGTAAILRSANGSNWIPSAVPDVGVSTIRGLTNGIRITSNVIGKVFISAGTVTANTINMNNGLITNICSMRFTKIDIAGTTNTSVSLGTNAGRLTQSQDAIAIGTSAGFSNQQPNAIAIGNFAGQTNQATGTVAIGQNAGNSNQLERSIAIGSNAGRVSQGAFALGAGLQAAETNQGQLAVALGPFAGNATQGPQAVAIGYTAGQASQSGDSVAIGTFAGRFSQGPNAVAIGINAGNSDQESASVAIGQNAGTVSQKQYAVAMGFFAGYTGQASGSIAIGQSAGQSAQDTQAIAIGGLAGFSSQRQRSVAIGFEAGTSAGSNAIAIGYRAGYTTINNNTIVLNATGGVVNGTLTNAFYVQPMRSNTTANTVFYDATSGEVSYGVASGTFTTTSISTNSISTGSIYADYISVNSITVFGPSTLTVQGITNLNTVNINTLSTGIVYVNTLCTTTVTASLSSNVTSNVAYYNTGTGQLSYGAAPQGEGSVTNQFSTLFTSSFVTSTITLASGRIRSATNALAFGNGAGGSQANAAIAIGASAAYTSQDGNAIALGNSAGYTSQAINSIAIGTSAGDNQAASAIAIGDNAGGTQLSNSIAIGTYAGKTNQLSNAIAIGFESGNTNQSNFSIAIGNTCGRTNQKQNSVAIGNGCAYSSQDELSVAIGFQSGKTSQGSESIAIGNQAGFANQGGGAIAIGKQAGYTQGNDSIAIGKGSAFLQGSNSIAIGLSAGNYLQGNFCVALGNGAGGNNQSNYAVAIGAFAGQSFQHSNTIILNASEIALNSTSDKSFYVKPVRNATGFGTQMNYDSFSGEITYGTPSDSNLKENIKATSNYFEALLNLRPVEFRFKEDVSSIRHIGFIAQEVQPLLPALVEEHNSTLYMNYNAFHPMYITAFQSLQSTNQGLQSQLNKQEQMLQALYSTLNLTS